MKIYRVGGYVRDKLLGISPHDCDYVVVGSTVNEMLALGYVQVGKAFPVFLHPVTHEEYALARTEKKSGSGHQGFVVQASPEITLEEDLSRRDLTINAVAEGMDGALIDPYGGVQDLRNGIIRHVSPAFKDDPLRILRVARFAARFNFGIAPLTMELLTQMAQTKDGLTISRERIINELQLALHSPYPCNFFDILRTSNNLAIFFPLLNNIMESPPMWEQFKAELPHGTTFTERLIILSYNLLPQDLDAAIHELTRSKQEHKFIRHANLLQNYLLNFEWNWNSEKILALYKQFDVWRNFDSFESLSTTFEKLLFRIPRLVIYSDKLVQIKTLAKKLKELSFKHLLSQQQDKSQLINAIYQLQIQTISKFQAQIISD